MPFGTRWVPLYPYGTRTRTLEVPGAGTRPKLPYRCILGDDWFANVDSEYSKIEVEFETYSIIVWKSGASLLYEQDMEEFHKTCAQCGGSNIITYEGWDGVHYEFENSLDPLL